MERVIRLKVINTYACTLRCTYCFEHRHDTALSLTKEDFLKGWGKCKKYITSPIQVLFFGGEPLLNFDIIKFVVETLGKGHHYGIFTNGTIYKDEYVDYFKTNEIKVMLSLDGINGGNNLRIYPDGGFSEDIVLNNIKQYLNRGIFPTIGVCLHDISINNLAEMVDLLSDWGVKRFEFRTVSGQITNLDGYDKELKKITGFYNKKGLFIDPPFESAYRSFNGSRWPDTTIDSYNLEIHPTGKVLLIPSQIEGKYENYINKENVWLK